MLHSDHIVSNQYGKPFTSSNNTGRALVRAMVSSGVRYRDPYNVRHSCACRMLAAGMRPGWCAEKLGHSLEMFFTTYAAWIDQDESKAQEEIFLSMS